MLGGITAARQSGRSAGPTRAHPNDLGLPVPMRPLTGLQGEVAHPCKLGGKDWARGARSGRNRLSPVVESRANPSDSDESKRLTEVYTRYAGDRRKSQSWALDNPGQAEIRADLLERVLAATEDRIRNQPEILDLGCGSGWWLDVFGTEGVEAARLHGLDAIGEHIEAARARLPGSDLRVGDIRRLPYPNDHFDVVLIVSVLSDLQGDREVEGALREAVRVLAPGGILLCYEPRLPNPFNRQVRRISKRTLRRALGRGWRATALTVLPPISYRLGSFAPRIYPWLARISPLLSHRLVEYRK
jgi:SAM-dependent methyltransferase